MGRYSQYAYFLTGSAILKDLIKRATSFLFGLFYLRFLVNSRTRSPTLYIYS